MALFPCNFGSSGGTLSETTLWTNPSPSSSFDTQTITLSQSVDNFKYLKIKAKPINSSSTESDFLFDITTYKATSTTAANNTFNFLTVAATRVSAGLFVRTFAHSSSTQMYIGKSTKITGESSSSGSTNNNLNVFTKVIGMK